MSRGGRSALARSRSIDHQLDEERERRQREIQLLVLGGAGSGKSTFIKQLRLHYGDGFPEQERGYFRPFIFENITHAFHTLVDQMQKLGIPFQNHNAEEYWDRWTNRYNKYRETPPSKPEGFYAASAALLRWLAKLDETEDLAKLEEFNKKYPRIRALLLHTVEEDEKSPIEKGLIALAPTRPRRLSNFYCHYEKPDIDLFMLLWRDAGMQKSYSRRHEFRDLPFLTQAEEYFLDNMTRITAPNYNPAIQDIFFIRKATLGVQEHHFHISNLTYRVIDVAGQKSQRKKWIHFFEGVTAVVFFVALSEFNENLEEDISLNSLKDSIHTFNEVIHNHFLERTDFLLFLNKEDLFQKKMKSARFSKCFPDYKGENRPEACLKYIRQRFMEQIPQGKSVYTHVCSAINIGVMKNVLLEVIDNIVEINLRKIGPY